VRARLGGRGPIPKQPSRAVSACASRRAGANTKATIASGECVRVSAGGGNTGNGREGTRRPREDQGRRGAELGRPTCARNGRVVRPRQSNSFAAVASIGPGLIRRGTRLSGPHTSHRAPRTRKPKFRAMTEGSCPAIVIHGFVPSLTSTGPGLRRSAWTEDHVRSPGTCQYWPRAHDPR
jgi:hypothetical protein